MDTINFNLSTILPPVSAALVAVVGWWIVHLLSVRRDRNNKKRDLQIQYLIDAYRFLEKAGNRKLSKESAKALEAAVADIQLFGDKNQVQLALAFARDFSNNRGASLDPLLESLRKTLRIELGLEEVSDSLKYLRVTPDEGEEK